MVFQPSPHRLASGDERPEEKDLPPRVLPKEQGLASEHSEAVNRRRVAAPGQPAKHVRPHVLEQLGASCFFGVPRFTK